MPIMGSVEQLELYEEPETGALVGGRRLSLERWRLVGGAWRHQETLSTGTITNNPIIAGQICFSPDIKSSIANHNVSGPPRYEPIEATRQIGIGNWERRIVRSVDPDTAL
jgi:hypothetical protein